MSAGFGPIGETPIASLPDETGSAALPECAYSSPLSVVGGIQVQPCCCPCVVLSDDFSRATVGDKPVQAAGTWTIGIPGPLLPNGTKTSDANALCYYVPLDYLASDKRSHTNWNLYAHVLRRDVGDEPYIFLEDSETGLRLTWGAEAGPTPAGYSAYWRARLVSSDGSDLLLFELAADFPVDSSYALEIAVINGVAQFRPDIGTDGRGGVYGSREYYADIGCQQFDRVGFGTRDMVNVAFFSELFVGGARLDPEDPGGTHCVARGCVALQAFTGWGDIQMDIDGIANASPPCIPDDPAPCDTINGSHLIERDLTADEAGANFGQDHLDLHGDYCGWNGVITSDGPCATSELRTLAANFYRSDSDKGLADFPDAPPGRTCVEAYIGDFEPPNSYPYAIWRKCWDELPGLLDFADLDGVAIPLVEHSDVDLFATICSLADATLVLTSLPGQESHS